MPAWPASDSEAAVTMQISSSTVEAGNYKYHTDIFHAAAIAAF